MEKKKTTAQRQAMYVRVQDAIDNDTSKEEQEDLLSRFPAIARTDRLRTIKARANETDKMMMGVAEELHEETQDRFCKKHGVRFDCDNEVWRSDKYDRDTEYTEDEEWQIDGEGGRDEIYEREDRLIRARVERFIWEELDKKTWNTAEEKQEEHDRKIDYIDRKNRRHRY